MSDILLDDDGDLLIENGDLQLCEGVDRVRQYLRQRLAAFQGEWFLDLDEGVPYYQDVLKKNPDPIVLDGVFKERIVSTPGIISLDEFDLTLDTATRQLNLRFKATSKEGPIEFDEPVGVV